MSAVLSGLLVAAAVAGSLNPHLSTDGSTIASVQPPYGSSAGIVLPAPSSLLRHLGIQHSRVLGYDRAHSYFDDFYNHIQIIPSRLDLGNIADVQPRSIVVWNAFTEHSQIQTALQTTGATGITITAPSAFPITMAPLEEATWTISVSPTGPPIIAATLSWLFSGLPTSVVPITGNRIAAWPWSPNWKNGIIERDTWRTDIQLADTGAEQRIAIRLTPRRSWEFEVLATGPARQWLESALFDFSGHHWALPVWPDVQRLSSDIAAGSTVLPVSPTDRDYRIGGLAMIATDALQYELVEVSTLTATIGLARGTVQPWPAGSRVYPVRAARLVARAQLASPTADAARCRAAFESSESLAWPAIAPATLYRGLPVLSLEPLYTEPRAQSTQRLLQVLDNEISLPSVTDPSGIGYPLLDHRLRLDTPAARASWRSLTYALRGRQGVIWVPSYKSDLSVVAPFISSSVSLDVSSCGLVRYIRQQPGRRDVRIEMRDGSLLYRRITAAITVSSTVERITLDAAMGVTGIPGDIRRVSWLVPCRLASDAVEYAHATAHVSHVQVTFRGVPDDV